MTRVEFNHRMHPSDGGQRFLKSMSTAAFEAFFQGVAAHEQGARVWDAAHDESN